MTKKKIISYLAAVFFLIAIALSFDFIAVNAEHECIGDDCRICAVMQLAEDICGGKKQAQPSSFNGARSYRAESVPLCDKSAAVASDSPVSRCDILTI